MTDLEKVIKGLELLHKRLLDASVYDRIAILDANMVSDALALLKAQEPRVMTLEEAKSALKNDPVIWFEEYIFGTDRIIAGVRIDGTDYFTMQTDDVMNVDDLDDEVIARLYGNRMRMWTSCPTEEQRKAVKWDE